MLGRSERESGAQALLAATAAGWVEGDPAEAESLLDLGSTTATLSTVASIDGLSAVVHLGHPAQPSHELERALLAGPPSLVLTGASAVPAQWVWVGRSGAARDLTGHVVVDEAGMRDRRHVLRTMGVSPSLVPTRTSLEERVALAGPDGSGDDPGTARAVTAYAYARTGYHRGLAALRRAGWRGQGPIPADHEPNQGFLRALLALSLAAGLVGEREQVERCAQFLRDLGTSPDEVARLVE